MVGVAGLGLYLTRTALKSFGGGITSTRIRPTRRDIFKVHFYRYGGGVREVVVIFFGHSTIIKCLVFILDYTMN